MQRYSDHVINRLEFRLHLLPRFSTPSSDVATSNEMVGTSEESFFSLSKHGTKSPHTKFSGRGRVDVDDFVQSRAPSMLNLAHDCGECVSMMSSNAVECWGAFKAVLLNRAQYVHSGHWCSNSGRFTKNGRFDST